MFCAASVWAQQNIEDTENEQRRVGLALHQVAYDYFVKGVVPKIGDEVLGVILTYEMLERIKVYIDVVESIVYTGERHFEERLTMPAIHPECFGTVDNWSFHQPSCTLTICDYKDGFGSVEAIENWQLILYAEGVISKYLTYCLRDLRIRFIIVQPQDYQSDTIKIWDVTYGELAVYLQRLRDAATAVMSNEKHEFAGPHCKHCKAKFSCKSNSITVNNLSEMVVYNPEARQNDITKEISWLRHVQAMVKSRLEAIESKAIETIRRGELIPGWTIEHGRGKKYWKEGSESKLDEAAEMFGISIRHPAPLLTPAQTKTALKKAGLPDTILDAAMVYRPGSPKLKPVDLKKAQEIFKEK